MPCKCAVLAAPIGKVVGAERGRLPEFRCAWASLVYRQASLVSAGQGRNVFDARHFFANGRHILEICKRSGRWATGLQGRLLAFFEGMRCEQLNDRRLVNGGGEPP